MIKVGIFASNWVDGAFILVYAQPRHLPECLKNDLDGVDVLFFFGFTKIAASSAYMDVLHFAATRGSCVRTLWLVARSKNRCNGSMAKMKSIGDSGSPWRTPLAWRNFPPGTPFSKALEAAARNKMETHSRQRGPNPRACSTSSKYLQLTMSKAF
jgi:hypothetical protein